MLKSIEGNFDNPDVHKLLIKHFIELKLVSPEGEFKSIRVNDEFRQKGCGLKVINHLIEEARKLGIRNLSLETGAGRFFVPARNLFIKCGFKVSEPFSHYKKDINSVYMSMLISND